MKKILLTIIVLGIAVTAYIYRAELLVSLFKLEGMRVDMPLLTAFILILLKIFSAPIAFPGTPLTLLTGSLFGNFLGTIIALIGNTLGATLAFLLSRYLLRSYVQDKIVSKHPLIKIYEKRLESYPLSTVIILRLIPLFPFNALNFLLGVTNIPFGKYVLGSFVGMIPGTFMFVYLGESFRMLSFINIILAITGIGLLTYLGMKYTKKNSETQPKVYDVIVIGAGSGGLNVAAFANRVGLSTLLVDKSDANIGGDCLNFGCVPSKALIHVAQAVRLGRDLKEFGIESLGKVDMRAVMAYVKGRQDIIREHENAEWFRKKGMTVALGKARFVGRNKIVVGETIYQGKRIVLATGSRPRSLSLPGMEHVPVFNNENIFGIDFLPDNLVIIGGGPISMEIGQAFQSLGAQVTIIEQGDKFLPKEDKDVTDVLYQKLILDGAKVLFNAKAKHINKDGTIVVESGTQSIVLPIDALFVGIGRELNIDGLDLDTADIKLDPSGQNIQVDQYLRTTNKNIVVCGDVAGQYQFTHAAELHASIIIRNFFAPFKKKLTNDYFSWVTFTNPEIATFGISSKELTSRGIKHEILIESFTEDDRAITDDYRDGLVKLYIGDKGKLLGGTMVAPGAGELAQELILAQTHGMSLSDVFAKTYPYPTATRINKRIAGNYLGRKLNDRSKRVLRLLFRLFA